MLTFALGRFQCHFIGTGSPKTSIGAFRCPIQTTFSWGCHQASYLTSTLSEQFGSVKHENAPYFLHQFTSSTSFSSFFVVALLKSCPQVEVKIVRKFSISRSQFVLVKEIKKVKGSINCPQVQIGRESVSANSRFHWLSTMYYRELACLHF